MDIGAIAPIRMGRGRRVSIGPDLGALVLAPSIASAIATKKVFYNLSKHRKQVLTEPHNLCDGLWLVQGFLNERTAVKPDKIGPGVTTFFYNFSGVGGPEQIVEEGAHDYVDFPVGYEARSESPVDWGGMSGGGPLAGSPELGCW